MKLMPRARVAPDLVLDSLSTAVICVDPKLNVAAINSAAEGLFGVGRRHSIGTHLAKAVDALQSQIERLEQALENGTGYIERELELVGAGGSIMVDCTVTPVLINKDSGLIIECLSLKRRFRISRDELLLSQNRASREVIRGLAHEIKNPLGGIRGAAQLLEKDFPDHEHREYTGVIIREADRLQNLVNRMLGPSGVPNKASTNIHEVLEHVRQLCEAEATPDIEFRRDYDPSIPNVVVDREQLIQAVLNVTRNAMQAIQGGLGKGVVSLRTRTRRQFTIGSSRHRLVSQIDIEDNGPGIPTEIIDQIFYPMVTTRADGTGLGLPMAQYLINAHGGLVECGSRKGRTVFSLYIPLAEEAACRAASLSACNEIN